MQLCVSTMVCSTAQWYSDMLSLWICTFASRHCHGLSKVFEVSVLLGWCVVVLLSIAACRDKETEDVDKGLLKSSMEICFTCRLHTWKVTPFIFRIDSY